MYDDAMDTVDDEIRQQVISFLLFCFCYLKKRVAAIHRSVQLELIVIYGVTFSDLLNNIGTQNAKFKVVTRCNQFCTFYTQSRKPKGIKETENVEEQYWFYNSKLFADKIINHAATPSLAFLNINNFVLYTKRLE